ncbi:MAG: ABC transporter permease [Candidatus Omnitrophota bacterium]
MSFHRICAILLRQFYLMRGSFTRVVPLFIWVVIDIVLWGFMSRYLNSVVPAGLDFIPVILGAVLLWDFFLRIMQGVTMVFFEDVWSRNFLNIFASPLLVSEYIVGLVFSSMVTSCVGVIMMLILATGCFGLSFAVYGLMLVPFIFVLFLFGIAMGVVGCAVVLRFGPAAEWLIWPLPALIAPFAGVFYPLSTLPSWMQIAAHAVPPSYVFEVMRIMASGGSVPLAYLGWSLTLSVLYVIFACKFFTATYRHAVRTGLIARYSAENLG